MDIKWDNWGLPIKQDDSITESCKDLAIYFINIYCFKLNFDAKFKKEHPQRERTVGEDLDEYDNYLTQHLNAYKALLSTQNLQYMIDADVHLHGKVSSLLWGDDNLLIHPQLGRVMNRQNLAPMLCCLLLYGFIDIIKSQDTSYCPQLKDIQHSRSKPVYRFLGDVIRLGSILFKTQPEMHVPYLVLNKVTNTETFIAKISKWLFFKKNKEYGNIGSATIEWITT